MELSVDDAALPDYSRDLERYLVRLTNEARDRRKQVINAISTRQADRWTGKRRWSTELWKMLGGPLERTPLNPRVTGIVERPGYRIEKVTFESRPRLYVTANLYVPAAAGRHPAILGPLGHSVNGKAWPSYQKLFSNLARKGYVVLAYDPFGQGERIEYPGSAPRPVCARAAERASTNTPDAASFCSAPTSACSARGTASAGSTTC